MGNIKKETTRVCIYGIGGVGGYFGGKLAYYINQISDSNYEVYFVARGEHLERIKENGLALKSTEQGLTVCKPTLAVENITGLSPMDLILVCVKSYDLEDAIRQIAKNINQDTIIIPLLNGIDIYDRIRRLLNQGFILPGCVYIGSHIAEPGQVVHTAGDLLIFGKDPKYSEIIPEGVLKLFDNSGINYKWFDNPYPAIWEKFIFVAAFGLVTAYTGKTMGEVMDDQQLKRHVCQIMQEIVSIAKQERIDLRDTIVADSLVIGGQVPYELKTSLQRDVGQKKKNEGDLLGGTIIEMGKKHGIPTPVTETVYDYIQNYVHSPKPEYF